MDSTKPPPKRAWIVTGLGFALLLIAGCGDSADTASEPSSKETTSASHEHETAGETCFICDPTKREAGRLWCAEHSRYEDRCWLCQPQLEEKGRLYCEEHSLYEDECHLCHPELKDPDEGEDKSSQATQTSRGADALFCNEHQVPEAECGICQPQLAAGLGAGEELKVRFESVHSAEKAGIQTVPARATEAQPTVRALCEVTYNENELARITPLAAGIVRRVHVDVGDDVAAGDLLVELHSADVASAKAAFIAAVVDLNLKEVARRREQRLAEKNISSEKELQEADAACKTAELTLSTTRQRLLNFGFTEEEVAAISTEKDSSASLLVRAPYMGTVVDRAAVVGEAAAPGNDLLTLANLETMWLTLSVPGDRASVVERGSVVEATFDALAAANVRGSITWVNTSIDVRTRMLKARAVVDNSGGALKSGMFGTAQVRVGEPGAAVTVPQEAIQRYEQRPYVFVKVEDDLYSLRRVDLAQSDSASGAFVAVLAGLTPNEPVVSEGAFTVMSEFLKSRLGAGCVDD